MRWVPFFLLLMSFNLWAKPLVLVSYFDVFGNAPFNNSETVGMALEKSFKNHPTVDVRFCRLNTVFDKAYAELEDCYKALPTRPHFVLGLGEATCDLKMEMVGRNLDKSIGPDNDGNQRNNTKIIPEGPAALALRYPLPELYCSLNFKDRQDVVVSNNAGSFVCNNLIYLMAYHYPEVDFGFMHVPANNCRNLKIKNLNVIKNLETIILKASVLDVERPLPIYRSELNVFRSGAHPNSCLKEFYKRAKGIDEKSLWPF